MAIAVNPNSWHYRVYCWFYEYSFFMTHPDHHQWLWIQALEERDNKLNICPYLRTFFIWVPLMALWHLVVIAAPVAAIVYPLLSLEFSAWWGATWKVLVIVILMGLVMGAAVGVAMFIALMRRRMDIINRGETPDIHSTTLRNLVGVYLRLHRTICPPINLEGEKHP